MGARKGLPVATDLIMRFNPAISITMTRSEGWS